MSFVIIVTTILLVVVVFIVVVVVVFIVVVVVVLGQSHKAGEKTGISNLLGSERLLQHSHDYFA